MSTSGSSRSWHLRGAKLTLKGNMNPKYVGDAWNDDISSLFVRCN